MRISALIVTWVGFTLVADPVFEEFDRYFFGDIVAAGAATSSYRHQGQQRWHSRQSGADALGLQGVPSINIDYCGGLTQIPLRPDFRYGALFTTLYNSNDQIFFWFSDVLI